MNWLDIDLLAKKLTNGNFRNIWVFYSGERIGPSEARIDGEYLKTYISRINFMKGVTASDVNISGQQREAIVMKCDKCKHETQAIYKSEKGIDAALTVHLFDTMDSWEVAYLLSCDADFVPAVNSLRRRGKIIIGAGFPNASTALIRECYEYVDLMDTYLNIDFFCFSLFRKNGIIGDLFNNIQVRHDLEGESKKSVGIELIWDHKDNERTIKLFKSLFCDITSTKKLINDLEKFPHPPIYFGKGKRGGHGEEIHIIYIPLEKFFLKSISRKITIISSTINFSSAIYDVNSPWFAVYNYNKTSNDWVLAEDQNHSILN